jgi:hypothetical protein
MLSNSCSCGQVASLQAKKEADVVERPEAFDHVGLLLDEPPGAAGLLFA